MQTDDHRDGAALDKLAVILRAPRWRSAADCLDAIADIVTATGRSIVHETPCIGCGLGGWDDETCSSADAHDIDAPTLYRIKYEDRDGEELVPYDAFTTLDDALAHFRAVIGDPWSPKLGGIYMTQDTGDDDAVIMGTHVRRVGGGGHDSTRFCYWCHEALPPLSPDATFADEMSAPTMHPDCRAEWHARNARRAELQRAALDGPSTLTADDHARVAEAFLSSWHRRGEDDADGAGGFHPRRPDLPPSLSQSDAVRWLQAETSHAAGKHRGQGTGAGLWWDTYRAASRGLFVLDTAAGRSGVVTWAYVWQYARTGSGERRRSKWKGREGGGARPTARRPLKPEASGPRGPSNRAPARDTLAAQSRVPADRGTSVHRSPGEVRTIIVAPGTCVHVRSGDLRTHSTRRTGDLRTREPGTSVHTRRCAATRNPLRTKGVFRSRGRCGQSLFSV